MWLIVIAVVGVGFLALFAVHRVRAEKIQEDCIESLNRLRANHDAFAVEMNGKYKAENAKIRTEVDIIRSVLDQKTAEFQQKSETFSQQITALEGERDALKSCNRKLNSVITNVRKAIEL